MMVRRLLRVEMQVAHRRSDGADLHENEERGGGQPAKHTRIVVNRPCAGSDDSLKKSSEGVFRLKAEATR